jgi:hypothetical protein
MKTEWNFKTQEELEGLLTSVLTFYERGFREPPCIPGINMTKRFYGDIIEQAKEIGLNVSEYPVELNHLDSLLK